MITDISHAKSPIWGLELKYTKGILKNNDNKRTIDQTWQ